MGLFLVFGCVFISVEKNVIDYLVEVNDVLMFKGFNLDFCVFKEVDVWGIIVIC